eukprot:177557-Chlamydomonas_euryale.AAC.5
MAMKPDWRPMSFTKPRPWYALLASTFAASSARCASSTAVSNPKQRSTRRMSLSMDFGTPMTAHVTPCASHSCAIACAAALPPLPPITNTMLRPHKSIRFTISVMLAPPREVPSMVPPLRWIPLTSLVVRVMGLSERSHAVVVQRVHDVLHHVVEAGAKAAARHDGRHHLLRAVRTKRTSRLVRLELHRVQPDPVVVAHKSSAHVVVINKWAIARNEGVSDVRHVQDVIKELLVSGADAARAVRS